MISNPTGCSRGRGFTLMECILFISVGLAVMLGGLALWDHARAGANLRARVAAISLITHEFERMDRNMTMELKAYHSEIKRGAFGYVDMGFIEPSSQIWLEQEAVGGSTARMVYFWFHDADPMVCNGLRRGLTTRNGYYYNGFSAILGRWLSLECRPASVGHIIEMRVPYFNAEAWVRGKGYVD